MVRIKNPLSRKTFLYLISELFGDSRGYGYGIGIGIDIQFQSSTTTAALEIVALSQKE